MQYLRDKQLLNILQNIYNWSGDSTPQEKTGGRAGGIREAVKVLFGSGQDGQDQECVHQRESTC